MDRIIEFIGNHPLLVLATAVVAVAIIVTEILRLRRGPSSVEPATATQLYNRENALFVDIRSDAEFHKAHLPGAMHIPASTVAQRLDRLEPHRGKPIILYCNNGMQTGRVVAQLRKQGFAKAYQLQGGINSWQSAGYPLEAK